MKIQQKNQKIERKQNEKNISYGVSCVILFYTVWFRLRSYYGFWHWQKKSESH